MSEITPEARLSKLLWDAREGLEMWADMLQGGDAWPRRVVAEIDAYRIEQGWSPDGFGGEPITHTARTGPDLDA